VNVYDRAAGVIGEVVQLVVV